MHATSRALLRSSVVPVELVEGFLVKTAVDSVFETMDADEAIATGERVKSNLRLYICFIEKAAHAQRCLWSGIRQRAPFDCIS